MTVAKGYNLVTSSINSACWNVQSFKNVISHKFEDLRLRYSVNSEKDWSALGEVLDECLVAIWPSNAGIDLQIFMQ